MVNLASLFQGIESMVSDKTIVRPKDDTLSVSWTTAKYTDRIIY